MYSIEIFLLEVVVYDICRHLSCNWIMAFGICFEESLFVEFDLVYQEPFSGIVTLTTRISFQSGQWFNSWKPFIENNSMEVTGTPDEKGSRSTLICNSDKSFSKDRRIPSSAFSTLPQRWCVVCVQGSKEDKTNLSKIMKKLDEFASGEVHETHERYIFNSTNQ